MRISRRKYRRKVFFTTKIYDHLFTFLKKKLIFLRNNFLIKKYYYFFIVYYFLKWKTHFLLNKNRLLTIIQKKWSERLFINEWKNNLYFYLEVRSVKLFTRTIFTKFRIRNIFFNYIVRRKCICYSVGLFKKAERSKYLISAQYRLLRFFMLSIENTRFKNLILIFSRVSKKLMHILRLLFNYIKLFNFRKYKRRFLLLKYIILRNPFIKFTIKKKKKPRDKKSIRKMKRVYLY